MVDDRSSGYLDTNAATAEATATVARSPWMTNTATGTSMTSLPALRTFARPWLANTISAPPQGDRSQRAETHLVALDTARASVRVCCAASGGAARRGRRRTEVW